MAKELKDGEQMISGEVVDVSPGAQFRVKLDNGKEILAHSAGKLKRRKIKIILRISTLNLSQKSAKYLKKKEELELPSVMYLIS